MIPQELKNYKNFIVWKYEERDGKQTKIPYNAVTGKRAKSNRPATWNTWDEVEDLPQWADGIGFMFSHSPFVGVDIDHCLDGGEEEAKAFGIAKLLGTYCEVSPSGDGLHMIGRGELEKGTRRGRVEIYPCGRYFTLTGDVWQGYEAVADIQAGLDELVDRIRPEQVGEYPQEQADPPPGADLSPDEVIEKIRRSRQAELFTALFDRGDISLYDGDESAADIALMNILPFWCGGDAGKMEDVFSMSALARREKWTDRPDYRRRTIEAALKTWNGEIYNPEEYKQKSGGLLGYRLTDAGNAERLRAIYADELLYVMASRKWLQWDGKRWKEDEDTEGLQVYGKAVTMLRQAFKEAVAARESATSKEDIKDKDASIKFFMKSENTGNIRNLITQAKHLFKVEKSDLDADNYSLNCGNGTVDLRTGELREHSRADYITRICRADYIPGSKSPLWESVLETILPDAKVRAWIKKFIGYSLYGLTSEEKFLFLYGPGGGGKGTFIESIAHVLGDYAGVMDIDTILAARNDAGDGGQATPQIASLAGKRLVVTSESGAGRKFNSAKIKLITGGDMLTARYLHGNPFTFAPQFSLVMSSNYKPALTDTTDEGMRRRLVIVPFTTRISKKDVLLKERLRTEARDAILSWCIDGAIEWWKNGGMGETPETILKAMGAYYEDNDIIGQFINENCEVGEGLRAPAKNLHKEFCWWLDEGRGMSYRTFAEQMENRGFSRHKYASGACFIGLQMKSEFSAN